MPSGFLKLFFRGVIFIIISVQVSHAQDLQEMITGLNETGNSTDRYKLLIKIGLNYQNLQAYKKAIYYYDEAIALAAQKGIVSEKTFIQKNKALCLEQLKQYSAAIDIWKALQTSSVNGKERYEMILALEKLSSLSVLNNQYAEAIQYSLILLEEYESQGNNTAKATLYNKLYLFYSKVNNVEQSSVYLEKCKSMVDASNESINENELCEILLNLGLTMAMQGELEVAEEYLNRSLHIRARQKKQVEQAEILNYLAALDMLYESYPTAKSKVERAIELVKSAQDEPKAEKVLMASYKVYGELLLRKKKIKEFRIYNDLYNQSRDRLIEKEQKQNLILLEQQVDIEKKENALRMVQSENKQREISFKKSELEREKKEQEIELQNKEIELLKKSRDLQLTQLLNKDLEQQKIKQLLELSHQRSEASDREKEIQILNKEREVQRLTIEKQARENHLLEMEKKARELKIAAESEARKYVFGLVAMLLLIIAGTIWLITQQKKNNRILGEQNNAIEIAREIISRQNDELKAYNSNLELEVNKRTEELIQTNEQLIRNNQQLEQFGYVVSHNLRGPIARLLGLSSIMDYSRLDQENMGYLEKIVTTSKDLDRIIHDLNNILEIRKNTTQEFETCIVLDELDKVLIGLSYQIELTKTKIYKTIPEDLEVKAIGPYLESIFYNLVSNAIKYAKEDPEITINAKKQDEWVIIEVKDKGIGIDIETHKDKLFGLYKRFHLHVEGKGLGLFMVKTQTEAMNGKIELESTPNVGTCFRIYLPS